MSRYVQSKVQSKQTAVPVWAGAKGKITSSVVLAINNAGRLIELQIDQAQKSYSYK